MIRALALGIAVLLLGACALDAGTTAPPRSWLDPVGARFPGAASLLREAKRGEVASGDEVAMAESRVARRADGGFSLGATGIAVKRAGAGHQSARAEHGALVFEDVFPGMDAAAFARSSAGFEELLLQKNEEAVARYELDLPRAPGRRSSIQRGRARGAWRSNAMCSSRAASR